MPRRPLLAAMILALCGCGGPDDDSGGPPPAPLDGPPTSIKQVMLRLAKGPRSLTPIIGDELNLDPPAWGLIDEQSHEFVALAAHGRLKGSCIACHAEHRGGRGMGPGPGAPPG